MDWSIFRRGAFILRIYTPCIYTNLCPATSTALAFSSIPYDSTDVTSLVLPAKAMRFCIPLQMRLFYAERLFLSLLSSYNFTERYPITLSFWLFTWPIRYYDKDTVHCRFHEGDTWKYDLTLHPMRRLFSRTICWSIPLFPSRQGSLNHEFQPY